MQFCADSGIPHSRFLSWDPVDRAKAMAYLTEKSLRCQMCGTADWEWAENPRGYEPVPVRCYGCYLKEVSAAEADNQPGVRIELMPAKGADAERRHSVERKLYELERRRD